MGNRLTKGDTAGSTTSSLYDAANRLTSMTGTGAVTVTNDADGNTLTGAGRTNAWDSQNRLTSCALSGSTSTYIYGADGLRRTSTVTPTGGSAVTTRNVYDGTMMVREIKKNVSAEVLTIALRFTVLVLRQSFCPLPSGR